jgi:hypothetical protein
MSDITLENDYSRAVEVDGGLFVVRMSDGGYSISDGPGSVFCAPDEAELAGWHMPVRFDSEMEAAAAIRSGPDEFFDIEPSSTWVLHCLAAGGIIWPAYGGRPHRE